MKRVEYIDGRGRKFLSMLEPHEPDDSAPNGILIGPPDIIDELGLPEDIATALHNQLYQRGLFTLSDIQKKPQDVVAALQKALNLNVQKIAQLYHDYENLSIQEV